MSRQGGKEVYHTVDFAETAEGRTLEITDLYYSRRISQYIHRPILKPVYSSDLSLFICACIRSIYLPETLCF